MSKDPKPVKAIFIPPKNPDERHKWISTWINSVFVIYKEVIDQTEKAKPENDYKGFRVEAEAARKELQGACEIKRQALHLLKETAHPQSEKDQKFTLIHTTEEKAEIVAPLIDPKYLRGGKAATFKVDDKGDSKVAEKGGS